MSLLPGATIALHRPTSSGSDVSDILGLGVVRASACSSQSSHTISSFHDKPFRETPASFWRPSGFPQLERRISWHSALAWPLRIGRLAWVAVTTPLWFTAVTVDAFVPLPVQLEHNVKTWTYRRRLFLPLFARAIWSIAGMGLPPKILATPLYEENIPPLARLLGTLDAFDVEKFKIAPARDEWLLPTATHPLVQPREVPAFWIRAKEGKAPAQGLDAVLLLAGGGYSMGHPLEVDRATQLAQRTGLPILGISLRKASIESGAYPAALQDAIAAYAFLCEKGYKRIAICGDSAGGGLSLTLLFHLTSLLRSTQPAALLAPKKLLLYSPWVDLTLSSASISRNIATDILNPSMMEVGSQAYTRHLQPGPSSPADSLEALGRAHPSLSPALPGGKLLFEEVASTMSPRPEFFVISGGLECMDDEISRVVEHIAAARLPLRTLRVADEVHCFPILPRLVSGPAKEEALQQVETFMRA